MLCNYETDYFLETIKMAEGRRYSSFEKPLVNRNLSRDDVAGFFRTMALDEEHKQMLVFVNHMQIADTDMIISATGIKFNHFKRIKEECISHGLLYENRIETHEKKYFWYLVDIGGVYALEDMNEKHRPLPYTLTIEQKYKRYLKAHFTFECLHHGYFNMAGCYSVKDSNGKLFSVELMEDIVQSKLVTYENTIFLLNLENLKELGIEQFIKPAAQKLEEQGNMLFDFNEKRFLTFKD